MRFKNTSSIQDTIIDNARNADTVSELIDIIQDLDDQLTESKKRVASLETEIKELKATITELERNESR